jgi:hypothetical protein
VSNSPEINLKINNIIYDSRSNASIIVNKLNDYFLTMGDHNNKRPNNKNKYNTNNSSCSLYLRKITNSELNKIITDMNNDSAPGLDGIVIKNLKYFHK